MNRLDVIKATEEYVQQELQGAEGGHDWFHIQRVLNNARLIGKEENVDMLVVEVAALLHDIADSKFHDGDEEIGPRKAREHLESLLVHPRTVDHVENIIRYVSFKTEFDKVPFSSRELDVVKDADKLDALGAIGIARAFNFGGYKGNPLYDPGIEPRLDISVDQYKKRDGTTVNHFYEKLFKLKGGMRTVTGRRLAEQRHQFMEGFLEQFYNEWQGDK